MNNHKKKSTKRGNYGVRTGMDEIMVMNEWGTDANDSDRFGARYASAFHSFGARAGLD